MPVVFLKRDDNQASTVVKPPKRCIFLTLPLELHVEIAVEILNLCCPSEDFTEASEFFHSLTALRQTCKHFSEVYTIDLIPATSNVFTQLADRCEWAYRKINPFNPIANCNTRSHDDDVEYVEASKVIPSFIIEQGMFWLKDFLRAWKKIPRSKYRVQLDLPGWNNWGWISWEEQHNGVERWDGSTCRCEFKGYGEGEHESEERRDQLITNWLWAELLVELLGTFDNGKWPNEPTPKPDKNGETPKTERERKQFEGYKGKIPQKERIAMLKLLLQDFVPSITVVRCATDIKRALSKFPAAELSW
ncbi:hypothetical protein BJ508DRAFT_329925 [Ascobolus immersus RN42]|uniref:Uncharacterized protein n=1 Tax=Ascobolus immersus RN42 TaxID=1160509 RepID=A0A3N4HV86_ASCIM|nr:hypothetical protein BJ508DRAFT_329925 [Ascobolus immersus RN42]